MIEHSFVFLERISHTTEKRIWQQGVRCWDDFANAKSIQGFSQQRKHYYSRRLAEAGKHLAALDSSYFAARFPKSEIWRMYDRFRQDCLFLDIETTGYYGDITVLGVSDGNDFKALVKGHNLDKDAVKSAFAGKKMIVSFNGLSFDVPVIRRYFGGVVPDIPHLDLRFPLARLGYTGGLKNIEKELGVNRSQDVDGIDGSDAVLLWRKYIRQNDRDALKLLISYNEEDVMNLRPLADFVFSSMKTDCMRKIT
jgi:uncharacterized protein YprB with RNaseH-like and TPR domain